MTEAERTKLTKTAKANGKPLNGKPSKTPSKKKPKPTPPDLPTVATHGTHVDPQDVLDALALVPRMPLPDHHTVRNVWSNQDRALALRWAKSPTRDTDPMPEAVDAWLMSREAATSALGGAEPNGGEEAAETAASNVLPLHPATDTPEGENVELSKGEGMTVEELREYMKANFDPDHDDLSAVLSPLGYDYERFSLESCAPHWEEWQTDAVVPDTGGGLRDLSACQWWREKLLTEDRPDGWLFLDVYIPQEALRDYGKIFAVIVRPIAEPAADSATVAPTEETPAWLTEQRQLRPSGRFEMGIERVQLNPKLEHELAERMVNQWRDLEALEQEKKDVVKDYGDRIKFLKESLGRTSDALRNGWEDREVPCQWYYDYTNGTAELRRNDNGEVMKCRTIDPEERQLQLQMEEDKHPLDAEGQPESERDKLIAECTRKALGLRPTLKALYSCIADVMDYSRDRPDGWPYNPSAAVLHTWSYDGLHDFWLMLEAIAAAHAEGDVSGWYGFLPEGAIVDLGDEALDRYWQKADDNGVMPVEESADDSDDSAEEGEEQTP